MPRTTTYYFDWQRNKIRFRLTVQPAGSTTLDRSNRPAFKANPAAGTTQWTRIPYGSILKTVTTRAGYEGNAIGLPETSTMKMTWNLAKFFSSSELQDLQNYLVNPTLEGAGDLVTGATGRAFQTGSVITLYSDRGDSIIPVEAFHVEFQGVHRKAQQKELEINLVTGTVILEIELVHILRVVFETITADDIAKQILTSNLYTTEGPFRFLFNLIWESGPGAGYFAHVYGSQADVHLLYTLYKLADLHRAIENLCRQVYSELLRHVDANIPVVTLTGTNNLGPWNDDIITCHPPNYKADYEHQTTFINPAMVFIGSAHLSNDGTEKPVAGWLVKTEDQPSIFDYPTLYDLWRDHIGTTSAKAIIRQISDTSIAITYHRTKGSPDNERSEILPGVFKGKHKPKIGHELIATVDAEVPGAESGDEGTTEYKAWGTDNDQGASVPVVFHTLPRVGEADNVGYNLLAGLDPARSVAFINTSHVWVNTLFFMGTPAGLNGPIPIRVHHFHLVQDRADCMDKLETASLPTSFFEPNWYNQFWIPTRLRMIEMQRRACSAFAVCAYCGETFSGERQIGYPGRVPATLATMDKIGYASPTAWSSGASLLTGPAFPITGSFLSSYPGEPVLVSSEIDWKELIADVILIATAPE
jgi:hypothetical protein